VRVDRLLDSVVGATPDAPALLTDDGQALSYAQLAVRIDAAAQTLARMELGAGQRLVLVGENSADMVVLLLAAIRLRAWAVPLNARMSGAEIEAICTHCDPQLVYFATRYSPDAAAHARKHGATVGVGTGLSDGGFVSRARSGLADGIDDGTEQDVALMIYTSGTTGMPKGVMLTHANLDFVTRASMAQQILLPGDRMYHALPISHSYGLISALLCGLRAGATLRLVTRFNAEQAAQAILHDGITVFQGVPAMYARLAEWSALNGVPLRPNTLRMLYVGGSQLDASRKAQTEALLGVRLHHGYGMTESAPVATRTFGHAPPADVTAGWPIPGVEVVVRNEAGNDLPVGQRGEIFIRGPNVMKGYFRDPRQTASTIDAHGWLRTGDIGVFGPDGDVSIVGRVKEMIIRGGFNVYPAEVEKAIAAWPDVAQCAVIGRALDGDEEVIAFVEPVAGRQIDVDALLSHLRGKLAAYKLPSHIKVMAQLPASTTGKVLKASLRKSVLGAV